MTSTYFALSKKLAFGLVLLTAFLSTPSYAAKATKPYSMDGEFGFILTTGNTETTSISAGIKGTQELADWSNEYTLEGLYKQDEVSVGDSMRRETTAQKLFLSGQGNYKLNNPKQRLFVFSSYEDDRFSSFKYQATVALGWNQQLIEDNVQKFNYSVGPGYSFAQDQMGKSLNSLIVRAALDYSYKLSENARITQTLSTEYGEDNTKSRSKTSVIAQLTNGLSMKVSLKLDHNSDVEPGIEKLDTETSVTLVYSFF